MHAPQIQLLPHFADHCLELFHKILHVDPNTFDFILDQISNHPIFKNNSQNQQLPVALQLAIFLNRAGHYGNAVTPEDVRQWVGVSVGSVINCTHWVMIALLDQHDKFIYFLDVDDIEMENVRTFVEKHACAAWQNGVFAVDGSAVKLMSKHSIYSKTFYDRKCNYSLNCQVRVQIIDRCSMNLLITIARCDAT
ncbi:hypothetical protein M404DRAFT_149663 [Pisolithus tinctorius Marx 270]|uniref:Uncharacterized protein n=1 Tax=Pisolithus tinctorius Marx 270 TaxID=870435 RepID=A0A0C3JVR1_PISTI|nr:hypothetical protein M404DRAFT_149663 [Pisolithus tinctorius Marx 270]